MMHRIMARSLFIALITLLVFGAKPWEALPWRVFAQAGTGFVKINTTPVTGTTFVDLTVVRDSGQNFYQYQVIVVCPTVCGADPTTGRPVVGQSGPVTTNITQEPGIGTTPPSMTLTWVASTTPGVTYDIYRIQGVPPNPAGAVSVTPN